MSVYIMPVLVAMLIVYAIVKKVNVYNSFTNGAKGAITLVVSIFPYIAGIMIAVGLFRASGLALYLVSALSPLFNVLGIPKEVCELVLLRPFTGSGSLSLLKDIYITYGVDSYVARCASVILGSSETIFYVTAVYFSSAKVKNVGIAITVALICSLVAAIVSCLLCKVM